MIDLTSLDFSVLFTAHGLVGLLTLTALEIVLGIDNIIFISIISNSLATETDRKKARQLGLALAMITRVLLLLSLSWVMSLDQPFLPLLGRDLSGRDLVLIIGGLF
ncbi:MAG: TerC family protein, partial [Flavobacteriales bacterium]